MKIKESLTLIDDKWVRKSKGFRVRFQKMVDSELVTEYCPGLDDKLLESDVATWRLAWKLATSTQTEGGAIAEEELFNIQVLDDLGNPVKYYATNKVEVFNPKEGT